MAKRAYSPRDIAAKTYITIPWGEKWSKVFGFPSITETWFVSGSSASGKSSFVMQLAKELCSYGGVLYLSYEEGVSKSFQDRINRYKMNEVQGKFRVATDDTLDELKERLKSVKVPSSSSLTVSNTQNGAMSKPRHLLMNFLVRVSYSSAKNTRGNRLASQLPD